MQVGNQDVSVDVGDVDINSDAAEFADEKWETALGHWQRVCRGYADLMGDASGDIPRGAPKVRGVHEA